MKFFEAINDFLASSIGALNALLAIALVAIGTFAGMLAAGVLGLIAGLVIGCALAVVFCGVLAVLVSIRDLLATSVQQGGSQGSLVRD